LFIGDIKTVPFSPCAEHPKTTRNTLTEIQIVFHPVAQRAVQLANGTNNTTHKRHHY